MIPWTAGDRCLTADGRTGVVKSIDYGGVFVQLDATNELGREVRLYREDTLKPGTADLFTKES